MAIARELVDGSLGVIECARKMSAVHLYSGHVRQAIDEDYTVFVGIESETDHLPVGSVRRHWSPEALAQKDVEIREAEAFFRERAIKAAHGIIAKYERA